MIDQQLKTLDQGLYIQLKYVLQFFQLFKQYRFFNFIINKNYLIKIIRPYIYQVQYYTRELNFGKHENIAYSMLDQETKDIIFTLQYHAPGGESWQQAYERAMKLVIEKCNQNGTFLMYSHGGLICSITYNLGLQDSIGNCSCVGLEYDKEKKEMKQILFKWEMPQEESEIEI